MGKGKNGLGFGKADITVEKELQTEFNVKEAPELKLFFEGNRSEPISCKGNSGCVSIKAMLAVETQTPAFQWCERITSLLPAHVEPSWQSEGGGGGVLLPKSFKDQGSFQLVALPSLRAPEASTIFSLSNSWGKEPEGCQW